MSGGDIAGAVLLVAALGCLALSVHLSERADHPRYDGSTGADIARRRAWSQVAWICAVLAGVAGIVCLIAAA